MTDLGFSRVDVLPGVLEMSFWSSDANEFVKVPLERVNFSVDDDVSILRFVTARYGKIPARFSIGVDRQRQRIAVMIYRMEEER